MKNENKPGSTLLVTHTDRDGIFSGAALLRVLGDPDGPDVCMTQGSYLADELQEIADAGRTYQRLYVCDTYWHTPHADRLIAGIRRLLAPGGTIAWIDHHPETVEHEPTMRRELGLSEQSKILGDRAGKHEAVSLVAATFDAFRDPVVSDLLKATARGWERNGEAVPYPVQRWLRVVDGLPRFPELPPTWAAEIVRRLARGFDTEIPELLEPLESCSEDVERRTAELLARTDWPRLPSVDGGWGLLLDLRAERLANAYVLAYGLFQASDRSIDYFVVAENPGLIHYVSGTRARVERDRLERDRPAGLRVSTMHKGARRNTSATWRARSGIDLQYLTVRKPAPDAVAHWIDAHPYLVKGLWAEGVGVDTRRVAATAGEIGATMVDVLANYGWSEADRRVEYR
jgi:hypothetical protein